MNNITLLVSPDFIKENSNISDNTCEKYIQPAIRKAQVQDLQQLLGKVMVEKLQDMVADGSIRTLDNVRYKELLDICQYFLAYRAIQHIVFVTSSKVSNTGVYQTSDTNVQPYQLKDTFRIIDEYKNLGDTEMLKVQEWVRENINAFPELKGCPCTGNANLYSAASTGLWLGGQRGRGTYARNLREKYSNAD